MFRSFLVKMAWAVAFIALFSLKFMDISIGERLDEYPLESGWEEIGLPLQEVSTETWMQLNNRWMSVYELREFANELQSKLKLTSDMKPTCGEQDDFSYASFEGKQSDETTVTVTIQSTRNDNAIETQLGINTNHSGTLKNLGGYVAGLEKLVGSLGKEPHFKILLFGEYQGRLAEKNIKEFSGRVFHRIKAKLIDSAFEAGNSNQKGFTSLITDSINYNTKQMNIELGTIYDTGRNITQIILGSPSLSDSE